jgi:homocitrate synthase NifV
MDVRSNASNSLVLEDTTLRDGEQAPGVAFSPSTKHKIVDALIRAGVTSIEVGIPAMGGDELTYLSAVAERQDEARLIPWNRGVREEVTASLDLGFRAVHIGLPASDLHLSNSLGKDRNWLLRTARDLVSYAKDRGAFVSISAEDLARTDPSFLVDYANTVHEAGADRLRLSDTVGMLSPEGYGERVAAVAKASDIDLQCHAHNDFGLAVANTLAGIWAGARYFHVTINGIGERAGMADLAQIATTMRYLYDIDLGVKLDMLAELSRIVGDASRHQPTPWHPIVGTNVFAHESGIHVNAMLKDTSSFEPFPPEQVGGQRRYVLGKHSGRALIRHVLEENSRSFDDDVLGESLRQVRALATAQGREVSPDELLSIHSEITSRLAEPARAGTERPG